MRGYITKAIAILIVVGAYYGGELIKDSKKKNKPKLTIKIPSAFTAQVVNKTIPVNIIETGRLVAKNRIELFAEVQGVMEVMPREFKPGTKFSSGEVLVKIKGDDFYANLQAQKSVLQNLITSMLPDLKLDFPKAYLSWDAYLVAFDMDQSISPLPEPSTDKEKFFITGRNIYTTFYNTKNLEMIYRKYTLKAPFKGVLTEALVTPGSLVRVGQKLGEFIDPTVYELELALSKALVSAINIGKEVRVQNPENVNQHWLGRVTRINGKVDATTQTVQVFISVAGKELKEGLFLEAKISGKEKLNAIEVPRNLLVNDHQLYVVSADSTLDLKGITVLHKTQSTIVVQGMENGSLVLLKPVPGAYQGMKVSLNFQN